MTPQYDGLMILKFFFTQTFQIREPSTCPHALGRSGALGFPKGQHHE